ncbi:tyrosine-type recombinase/integrase [Echinicola shivajiensis]|uniref:tyrosine-type recombinase/integrase n=1 Tax=Echinicola shivajiensis TaxID=1035916 RepID=UPI001BFCABD1|nr:tyrosine-type recombinase/integrase [Echinicola shivajiensis]
MANYFFLKYAKSKPNQQNNIVFRIRINGKMIVKGLGIKLLTKNWDQSQQRIRRSEEDYKKLNDRLSNIEDNINQIENLTKVDVDRVISGVKANKAINSKSNLVEVVKEKMRQYEVDSAISNNTTYSYKYTLEVIENFAKENQFDVEGNLFTNFQNFINYCRKEGLKDSSIKTYLFKIKSSINSYYKANGISKPIPSLNEFKFLKEDKEKIYLTKNEIRKLYDYAMDTDDNPLTDIKRLPSQIKYLKYFLFRCFTGMRISEMVKKNIIEEKLDPFNNQSYSFSYYSFKTDKVVNIPTLGNTYAWELAQSLKFDFPEEYTSKIRMGEKRAINYFYKAIVKCERKVEVINNEGICYIPVCGNITSHVARRSFARMIYDHKKNIYFVSKLIGHSDISITQDYLGLNFEKEFEEYTDLKI